MADTQDLTEAEGTSMREQFAVDERLAFGVPAQHVSLDQDLRSPERDEEKAVPVASARTPRPFRQIVVKSGTRLTALLDEELAFGTLFLIIPLGLIAGAAIYFALPVEPSLHQLPIALVFVSAALGLLRRYAVVRGLLNLLLCCIVGGALAQFHTHWQATPMMGSSVVTTVTGEVLDLERRANGSARYTLRLLETERPKLRYPPQTVRVTSRSPNASIAPGDGFKSVVQLRAPSGPARPGGYDFAYHAYFAGYGANGFTYGAPSEVDLTSVSYVSLVNALRLSLADRIVAFAPEREASAVAAALVTGKKSQISDDVTEVLRQSGLAHILAISGLHMALVAGTVMVFVRVLMALDQARSAKLEAKKIAAVAALIIVTLYLFLAGASVATQRSYIMLAIMLVALCFDRPAVTKRNLAIAAIAIIFIAPDAVVTPGFQMSFAATLALIGGYDLLGRRRVSTGAAQNIQHGRVAGVLYRGMKLVLGIAVTAVIAGLATGIFSAFHFHRIAPWSLLSNVAAMPVVTFVTMPSAIVAMALAPVGLDGFVFPVMFWSIDLVVSIARATADGDGVGLTGALQPTRMLLLALTLVLFCIPRTAIRAVAAVPLLLAFLPFSSREPPILHISEDGKQVAAVVNENADGARSLAVNRSRPNRFVIDQWTSADRIRLGNYIKPNDITQTNTFDCSTDGICTIEFGLAQTESEVSVAVINSSDAFKPEQCVDYDILVESTAPAIIECVDQTPETPPPIVIRAQDLALRGSVEVFAITPPHAEMSENAPSSKRFEVVHALSANLRPWHSERIWSRAARDLAPYRRED
ncbi:MAG: ComEC/Rec2 family competence protein [Pseudomonadota bacterium]